MSVSFKREQQPWLLRRNGQVEDRTSGNILGRVFRMGPMHNYRWQWTEHGGKVLSRIVFGYETREQAVEALVRVSTKLHGSGA